MRDALERAYSRGVLLLSYEHRGGTMLLDERPLRVGVERDIDRGGWNALIEVTEQSVAIFLAGFERRRRRDGCIRHKAVELRSKPGGLARLADCFLSGSDGHE